MASIDYRSAVTDLYLGFLHRQPDAACEAMIAALNSGEVGIDQVIHAFLTSGEFAASAQVLRTDRFTNDQTQFGEFTILLRRMLETGGQRVVVDVGARGKERSNSFDLLKTFGWRGVLVEANPALAAQIREDFAGCDFTLEVCAVSDYEGEATFHIGVNDDVSSLDPAYALGWGEIQGRITVQVTRLPALLERNSVPRDFDLLSVDIEGEDIKVLNDLVANGWSPRWVIIEASNDFIVKTLDDAPFSAGVKALYSIVGQTPANLILERTA